MAQFPPTAKVLPQLLVWAKSPPAAMLLIVKGPLPVLLRVTVWAALVVPTGWLPKLRVVGDRFATGIVPVPVNGSTIGGLKLLLTLRVPCLVPVVVGAKVTVAVHWLPTGSGAGETQLSVSEKSPAALMAVIFKLLSLLVVLVKAIEAEAVLPTLTPLKVSWAGEGVSAGLRTVTATVIWRTDAP